MSKQAEQAEDLSLRELRDIVDRLGMELGEGKTASPSSVTKSADAADMVFAQAQNLRAMLRGLGPKAPACFTDRIVAAALEVDPVPDPSRIHELKD